METTSSEPHFTFRTSSNAKGLLAASHPAAVGALQRNHSGCTPTGMPSTTGSATPTSLVDRSTTAMRLDERVEPRIIVTDEATVDPSRFFEERSGKRDNRASSAPHAMTSYRFGSIHIQPHERRLTIEGRDVALGARWMCCLFLPNVLAASSRRTSCSSSSGATWLSKKTISKSTSAPCARCSDRVRSRPFLAVAMRSRSAGRILPKSGTNPTQNRSRRLRSCITRSRHW